ncbi:MAG: hypothetical protein ABFS18_02330 [Thermodesulfobacteriota bacterium]
MVEYRWYFLPMTFLMLGGAFYFTFFVNRECPGWRKWLLVTATAASIIILSYSFISGA